MMVEGRKTLPGAVGANLEIFVRKELLLSAPFWTARFLRTSYAPGATLAPDCETAVISDLLLVV